jgi:hypothetical protein
MGYIVWSGEVADHHLGAERANSVGALVIVVHQCAYRQLARAEQLDHGAANASDATTRAGHQYGHWRAHDWSPRVLELIGLCDQTSPDGPSVEVLVAWRSPKRERDEAVFLEVNL